MPLKAAPATSCCSEDGYPNPSAQQDRGERSRPLGRRLPIQAALATMGGAILFGWRLPQGVAQKRDPNPSAPHKGRALCARAASASRATLATSGGAILSGWCLPPSVVAQKKGPRPERTLKRGEREGSQRPPNMTARAALASQGRACLKCCSEEGTPTRAHTQKGRARGQPNGPLT